MSKGKPNKKVGELERDILLCQALEKTEIRSSVIRCEDSATMSQKFEIVLMLRSSNVKDSQTVEENVQFLPQTIHADTLPSVFTRTAVKEWLLKNFTVSHVEERKKYRYRSNCRRLKVICERCSHVNGIFCDYTKPGSRGQKKRLKFENLALSQKYLRAVIGLGRRYMRKSKTRSLLKGIETIECVGNFPSGILSRQPTGGDYAKLNTKSLLYPNLSTSKGPGEMTLHTLPEQPSVQISSCNRAGLGNHDMKN